MNGTIPAAETTEALTMVEGAGVATDDGADTILEVCDNQQVLEQQQHWRSAIDLRTELVQLQRQQELRIC